MKHYYTDNSDLKSEPKIISYQFQNYQLQFKSDHGVFSKDRIDYGSNVLLNTVSALENVSSILDVGSGYGVIGISLAKHYPTSKVTMIDVNNRAIALANENILINKIKNACVFSSDGYTKVECTFDLIISNPPIRAGKDVVHRILEEAPLYLNKDGSLWIVIQKKQGAPSAKKKLLEVFGNCEVRKRDKGYYVLVAYKK